MRLIRRDQSGQAMVEYSIVSWVLLAGAAGLAWPFLRTFFRALQQYYDSLYFVINLPFP